MRFRFYAGPHKTCNCLVFDFSNLLPGLLLSIFGGLLLGVVYLFSPSSAFAFTVNGETYPDDISDLTVTLNSYLTPPPDSICQTWYDVDLIVYGSSANPQGGAVSNYLWFENATHVASGTPWYWYNNWGNSLTTTGTPPLGTLYASRAGYDANAGWWGVDTRLTVSFNGSGHSIYTNHSFIAWLVDNSDYRARYEGTAWTTPTVVAVGNSIGWFVDENNTSFGLQVQRGDTSSGPFTNVQVYQNANYNGAYVVSETGYYRLVFNYNDGQPRQEIVNVGTITVTDNNVLSISRVDVTPSGSSQILTVYTTGVGVRLFLQREASDGSGWITVAMSWTTNITDQKFTSTAFYATQGTHYRIGATDANHDEPVYRDIGILNDGSNDDSDFNIANYVESVVQYIRQFVNSIGDLFDWLPPEIRTVLISCIIIMIVLGMIGWLKN